MNIIAKINANRQHNLIDITMASNYYFNLVLYKLATLFCSRFHKDELLALLYCQWSVSY